MIASTGVSVDSQWVPSHASHAASSGFRNGSKAKGWETNQIFRRHSKCQKDTYTCFKKGPGHSKKGVVFNQQNHRQLGRDASKSAVELGLRGLFRDSTGRSGDFPKGKVFPKEKVRF